LSHEQLAADYAETHPKPADAVYWPRAWHDSQCFFPMGVKSKSAPDHGCDLLADDPSTTTVNECSEVTGCTWDTSDPANPACTGAAVLKCSTMNKAQCGDAAPLGCAWDGTTCQSACSNFNQRSCTQAAALGCVWTAGSPGTCSGELTPPATCGELTYGQASALGCSWNVPKANTCATQVPSSCTGPGKCGTYSQVDCVADATCTWAPNGNGTACNNDLDAATCAADTTHHCTWWTSPLAWRAPDGCTGLEGMIDESTADDFNGAGGGFSGPDDQFAQNGANWGEAFKPGGPTFTVCMDPPNCNFSGDSGDTTGLDVDLLGGAQTRVIQYLGHGDINDVPLEGRDLRFFFKTFTVAYAKYMLSPESLKAGINDTLNPAPVLDFHGQFIDTDYLVFDAFGGNAARSEYIDYTNAGLLDPDGNVEDPTDLENKILLIGSNLQSTSFYRRLDREERALFEAMAIDDSQAAWGFLRDTTAAKAPLPSSWDKPNGGGKFSRVNANMFLTNVFGTSILSGIFSGASNGDGSPAAAPAGYVNDCQLNDTAPVMDAYYCATHIGADAAGCPIHAPMCVAQ
jgi:hypothetical protein